jgi:hypothetical protein
MNNIPTHSTFISFDHDDYQQVNGFIGLKNLDNNFDFVNRKLDYIVEGTDESITNVIRENYIKKSVVTVVMIGKQTHNSEWVEKEIQMTLRQRHGLLGILLKDTQPHTVDGKYYLPDALYKCVNNGYAKFIGWNPDVFKEEIHEAFLRSQQFGSYFNNQSY